MPTIVTSRPSRIQTVPKPITIRQWNRDQGSRSSLAGIWVRMVPRAEFNPSSSRNPGESPHRWEAAASSRDFSGSAASAASSPLVRLCSSLGDVEPKLATLDPDSHAIAGLELAGEQHPGKLVLDQTLNGAPQRSRTELGVEALLAEVGDRRVGELRLDPLGPQPAADLVKQEPGDLEQLLLAQRPEDDDLVDPVEELGPEAMPQ